MADKKEVASIIVATEAVPGIPLDGRVPLKGEKNPAAYSISVKKANGKVRTIVSR